MRRWYWSAAALLGMAAQAAHADYLVIRVYVGGRSEAAGSGGGTGPMGPGGPGGPGGFGPGGDATESAELAAGYAEAGATRLVSASTCSSRCSPLATTARSVRASW